VRAGLCIEIHDVAPATWPQCEPLLALVDEFGRPPVTMLAVPNYHDTGGFDRSSSLVRVLQRRVCGGDEIALHGYSHRDDAPPPRTPLGWVTRRLLTAGEGEFSAISRDEAAYRVRLGWNELSRIFFPMRGFVAPAWLSARCAWDALRESPLEYAATRNALIMLKDMRRIEAPVITVSSRSRWRRKLSRAWMHTMSQASVASPLLRVALHPADSLHDDVLDDWRGLLHVLLANREPLTTARALGLA
jgi:predicted deacetylase